MYNNEDKKEDVDGIVEDTQPNADKIESAIEDIVDSVKDLAKDAGADIDEALETVKGFAEDVAGKVKDSAEDVGEAFKDKYIKTLAEMENLRKRFDVERMDIFKYKASSFILSILPTVDMFEMALKAENTSEEVKNWLIGFEMVLNNFKTALEAEGVKEIETNKGDEFDGNKHHAIDEVETDEVEAGKVFEVKQKGYMIHSKLLRPTSVVVAKAISNEEEVEAGE